MATGTVRPDARVRRDHRTDRARGLRLHRRATPHETRTAGPHGSRATCSKGSRPSLINAAGNDPEVVLRQFTEVLAEAVISCDSPRFLAFIPAAPTKASLLFDMVVSASSLSGISWFEAAGAVHAENQALRFLADLAGLPEDAGGCFVQGGSAGNLSALAVARDTARARGHVAPARCRERAEPLVDHEHDATARRGAIARRHRRRPTHRRDPRPRARRCRRRVRGRGHGGNDERGDHRRSRRSSPMYARRVPSGCTSTRRTAAPRSSRRASATASAASTRADSFDHRSAQVAVRAVRLRGAPLPRSETRTRGAHAGRVVSRRDPRRTRRVEPV